MFYSIIIPTLANHDFFLKSLESIIKNSSSDSEIIVAYNGNMDHFNELKKNISHIDIHRNLKIFQAKPFGGIAKTCNDAFKISNGKYICYVHDDVLIFEKNWEEKLSSILDKYPEIGMIGGSQAKYIDRNKDECQKIKISENEYIYECDWSPTISMTKRDYMEMGCAFDEFYLCGLEDADWAISFRRIKKKVFYRAVKHKHIGNQGSYSLFKNNLDFLSYYAKEGPRVRYFIEKNKDILSKDYIDAEMKKWKNSDINLKKSWWKKLYIKYFLNKILKIFQA